MHRLTHPTLALVALALAAAGCAETTPLPVQPAATAHAPGSAPAAPLHFVEDDLAGATAKARAEGKALFVDAWAPWCHTCLSMQRFVLGDPSLRPLADRVVFASIDTDRPASAAFLARHAVAAWPTFFMIDPATDTIAGFWAGSASAREMRGFIEESLDLMRGKATDPASRALAEARAAHAAGDGAKAAAAYERAIAAAPPAWPQRSAALVSWMAALWSAKQHDTCVRVGLAHLNEPSGSSAPGDFASYLLMCAGGLPAGNERTTAQRAAVARLSAVIAHPSAEASIDDRADMLNTLADGLTALGEKAGARKAHEDRLALMEKAAREARSPEEAQTFDYGRAISYVALGRGEEAVKMLSERERQFPDAYEPVARLADALFKLGRLPEALAAADRAIARSYGPRKLRYMKLRADVEEKLGDRAAAVATRKAEVAGWEALPPGQASPSMLAAARRRLEETEGGAAAKAAR